MQTEIREVVNEAVVECLERADRLKDGSEERARELKNATALMDKLTDDYKIEEERLDRGHRLEQDYELEKRKLDIEEDRIEMESKTRGRIKPDTIANLVTISGLTVLGAVLESKGYRLPKVIDGLKSRIGKPKD